MTASNQKQILGIDQLIVSKRWNCFSEYEKCQVSNYSGAHGVSNSLSARMIDLENKQQQVLLFELSERIRFVYLDRIFCNVNICFERQ